MQLVGDEITVGRIDYRYEFKKDIFIKLMGNAAFGYRIDGQSPPAGNNIILGYAIGLQFQSIIGPFEFIYSRGDHSPLHLKNLDQIRMKINSVKEDQPITFTILRAGKVRDITVLKN